MKRNTGLADSPFFSKPSSVAQQAENTSLAEISFPSEHKSPERESEIPHDHDTTVSRYHDTTIEAVRRAVKVFGKEAATHRFTSAEKQSIDHIVHTLKRRGLRTTENEITRIAINFIINEFNHGEKDSLLALVLQALNR